MDLENTVQKLAIYSRVYLIFIQYFANILIPDHEAGVFLYPKINAGCTIIDQIIEHFLGGFLRWDGHYFMHIAMYGYTYESTLAFFPVYPFFVKLVSLVLFPFVPLVTFDSVLLLVFVGSNIVLFIFSAKLLCKITNIIFGKTGAYKTAVLFCFNPASVFFIAPYTESMFSYLTFQSILNCLLLYKKYSNVDYKVQYTDILYLLPICLSTGVRSNGILNIGFFAYTCICIFLKYYPKNNFISKLRFSITYLCIIFVLSISCLIPFIIYQIYCYQKFCTTFDIKLPENVLSYAKKNNLILPGQFNQYKQLWCYNKIPLAYSYVQDHYWNVGLFKYYELKQIPNFLLAAPILFIVIKYCCQHIQHNFRNNIWVIFSFDRLFKKNKDSLNVLFMPQLNVFVIHALFLSVFCALFIHIQVTTRMLCSASPLFYWICADYLRDYKIRDLIDSVFSVGSLKGFIIKIYFITYFIIGTALFCNFLPWT